MMLGIGLHPTNPELRQLAVEASLALAGLNAERLEELAVSCQALHRGLAQASDAERAEWARQARAASGELAVFARVLDATRANLEVMNRLRDRRAARLEYGASRGPWALAENGHGKH